MSRAHTNVKNIPFNPPTLIINANGGHITRNIRLSTLGGIHTFGISSGFSVSNKNSCIIIQNSGIGNIINPLTSFNLIYKIPALIIVGWRGHGGKPNDAPEHWIMGEETTEYFKMLDIPFACFEDTEESQEDIEKRLSNQLDLYSKEQQIRSIIIKKGVVI